MQTEWSINKELCKIAHVRDAHEALVALGVIEESEVNSVNISVGSEWHRSGSETYGFTFEVISSERKIELFLKACCPTTMEVQLEEQLCNWTWKRDVFSKFGINTPSLYYWGDGVILEERIPFKLNNVIEGVSQKCAEKFVENLLNVADKYKFMPIDPLRGLMSRGQDIVWIDFGQDLGSAFSDKYCKTQLEKAVSGFARKFASVH